MAMGLAGPALAGPRHPDLAGLVPPEATTGGRAPVVLAQAGDPAFRIGQLEEQNRALNGRIEELGFQLLQMQEQIRQMQQDNEFRFQQIEGGAPAGNRTDARPAVTEPQTDLAATPLPGVENSTTSSTTQAPAGQGTPPTDLGQILFNENGSLITPDAPAATGGQTASLDTPDDLYKAGYEHVLSGDYSLAEQSFRDYVDIYPSGPQASDAMFWLGESQFSQSRYDEAAKSFLAAHKQFPAAEKGPDTLLKLGMSLAALDNRDTACATYREVLVRYPDASAAIRSKIVTEQSKASC